jgi:hypothetical protein
MSVEIKLKSKKGKKEVDADADIDAEMDISGEECNLDDINNLYSKKCGKNNKEQLKIEKENRIELLKNPNQDEFLYPVLDDPNFNIKIAQKKEFSDTKYDGEIYDVEKYANVLKTAEYELLPQQAFVRNFLSFQTPYNSLLLFHGLGSGKTCSAIGVCEEMRDYLKQMGITKRIIIVASPNVQDNFKLQLFDERKLKEVDGIWTMKGCLGNKLLKEINPTGMKGLKKEKVIQNVKNLISASYSFQGYLQFSNEIVRKSGSQGDSTEAKIRNLEYEYSDRLIVIDEVHNIRISDDNENKNVAKNLMYLVSKVTNIRLLLLSATPMFNSYKEIVWLLNLMNMNDRRGIVSVSDIFDKNGDWKRNKDDDPDKPSGKEMLIRKATGYVSYVRGENPYTFPFRVYPDKFALKHTFKNLEEYPKYQINGSRILDNRKIEKLSLYLTNIGEYQQLGYNYIIDRLRSRGEGTKQTRKGNERKVVAFTSLRSFGYTDLQIPIEALNIIYPYDGLKELVDSIPTFEYIEQEEEKTEDIAPKYDEAEKDITDEISEVTENGPQLVTTVTSVNSELESEPAVTEGIEADETMFENVVEPDIRNIKTASKSSPITKTENSKKSIFNEVDADTSMMSPDSLDNKFVIKKSIINPTIIEPRKNVSSSFKGTLVPKKKTSIDDTSGLHNIEGETQSKYPSEKNPTKKTNIFGLTAVPTSSMATATNTENLKGGETSSSKSSSSSKSGQLYIDPKELTGGQGLKRIMNFVDTKTPAVKGQFEYKYKSKEYHVFENEQIGKYSSKIKTICDYIYNKKTDQVSDGIILIYSSYIDGGLIPMALALEEMGFTRYGEKAKPLFKTAPVPIVDVRTMKPPTSKKDFKAAKYVMITGDPRISPSNDTDVKALTNNDNIFKEEKDGTIRDISGEIIKVVLISQAGSEGLDFKAIRQIHIMEPWYNVNRIEQIIGRGVRNFSHKDLPFENRNVRYFCMEQCCKTLKRKQRIYMYIAFQN